MSLRTPSRKKKNAQPIDEGAVVGQRVAGQKVEFEGDFDHVTECVVYAYHTCCIHVVVVEART